MCRSGILVQGMCFLSATHSFGGKNLYREMEIGGRHITLFAIQTFVRKRVCRCREKSWEKERRLVNLGCREADLAWGEDRWKQRWE